MSTEVTTPCSRTLLITELSERTFVCEIVRSADLQVMADYVVYDGITVKQKLDELSEEVADHSEVVLPADIVNQHISGIKITMVAGEALAYGDVCFINSSGKMSLSSAAVIASASAMFICAEQTIDQDDSGVFLVMGIIRDDSWNWSIGENQGWIYLSLSGTSGDTLTQIPPSGTDNVIQVLGVALTPHVILFNPNIMQLEHN